MVSVLLERARLYSPPDTHDPELVLKPARALIEAARSDGPFFLWLHLEPPHSPYAAPPPFLGTFDPGPHARTRRDSAPPWHFAAAWDPRFPVDFIGRYDEAILWVDHHVGEFTQWLKDRGLYESSLFIVTSDHGESFTKGYGAHTGPLLHEPVIRVPLIVKEPGQRAGRRIQSLAEHVDVLPTILALVGSPTTDVIEGSSLVPAIAGTEVARPVFAMSFEQSNRFGELDTGTVVMVEGRWKYTHYLGRIKYPMMPRLEDTLHDIVADPHEETSLRAEHPAIAARMLNEIRDRLRRHGRPRE
jgi:arylsulfatase A-like enzyme